MKVVHVNNIDLVGSRFNGYNLQIELNKIGVKTKQFVYEKISNDPNVVCFREPVFTGNQATYMEFEKKLSIHGLIYPYGRKIMEMKDFKKADVVHYHLIHNYIISLFDFVKMTAMRPSVWTIHDPWAFTGHCIYPGDCTKWKDGCVDCGAISKPFSMKDDKASQMWNVKKALYPKIDADIVVASKWMLNILKESPLTSHFERIHHIPFGINLDTFKDKGTKEIDREELGISKNDFVICFRSDLSPFKGIEDIKRMLERLHPARNVTLLTVGAEGLLGKFKKKYKIKEYGWVTDEQKMAQLYSASDLFLMPSAAEAFGLMAIEAMASSRPIIVLEGTSLPDVTFAPECGIVLPKGDTDQFVHTVQRLIENQDECIMRGRIGRDLAEKYYDEKVYFNSLLELYKQTAARGKNKVL